MDINSEIRSRDLNPPPTVKSQVTKLLCLQVLVVVLVATSYCYFGDEGMGFSSLVGGVIAVVPATFYGWQILLNVDQRARSVFRLHIRGQIGKYLLTFLMFSISFTFFKQLNIIALFSSYLAALLVYWWALATFKDKVRSNGKS